jgi:hypothetical protein
VLKLTEGELLLKESAELNLSNRECSKINHQDFHCYWEIIWNLLKRFRSITWTISSSEYRSLSETSKNQLVLVSEPANLKAALIQVQVHAKAIEEWMLDTSMGTWTRKYSDKLSEKQTGEKRSLWMEGRESRFREAFGSNSECSKMIPTQVQQDPDLN